MRFVYRLEPQDYRAVVEAVGLRRRFGQPPDWLWYLLGAVNLLLTAIWWRIGGLEMMLTHIYTLGIAAFVFATPTWYRAHMRRAIRRHPTYGHEVVVDLAEREIVATYGETVHRFAYTLVRSIDERPDHLLLWIAKRLAIILPKRGLADGATIAAVRDRVEERRKAMIDGEIDTAATGAASRVPWVRRGDDEPVFEKTVHPTFEDLLEVDFGERGLVGNLTLVWVTAVLAIAVAAYLAFPAWQAGDTRTLALYIGTALFGGLALGFVLAVSLRWVLTAFFTWTMRAGGYIEAPVRMRFDREGIEIERRGEIVRMPWAGLVDIERGDVYYFFWPTVMQGHSIRLDAFADDAERESFEKSITSWYGRAPRHPPRMTRERTPPPEAASGAADIAPPTDRSEP